MCITMLFCDAGGVRYPCISEEVQIAFGEYVLVL